MDEHGKTYKFEKMSNQKLKSLWKCRSVKYVFLIDRQQEEKKKTTDEQIDDQKEDIKR